MANTTPGSRLGPYEILSRIGAGGMGEVFRARDTRLDRTVAIKVLPTEFAKNAALKLRFEREAKAISQLNHPHICTLYDVGEDYLVMELLEGETLGDRLSRGALPLPEVLKYGAQIADALDRAHRSGIVHRDLKPGNIMLTKSGAKLLDFGLAKSTVPQPNPDGTTVHHEKALTQEGTILGTFQYMAPEQLEAEEADARTDIFALGAVLYEMATGRRAFEGKTKTSLIAAIVGGQPQPLSQIVPLTPPALEHVIQKCLEKERDERWQSAHDVAEELKWIGSMPVHQQVAGRRTSKAAVAAAVLLAVALAAITALWLRERNRPKPRAAFAILPPHGATYNDDHVALLSPDGTIVAFSAASEKDQGGIWVRRVDQIEAKRLTNDVADRPIAWSPDSKWIAYLAETPSSWQLRKIAIDGGTPEVIASRFGPVHGGATWGPDGTFVYSRIFGEALTAMRPNGGEPRHVTSLDAKRRESFHGWPQFLSDGKRFLYVVHTTSEQKNEIWAGSLDGKVRKLILRADSLVGVARSHLYFVRDGAMYAQRFDTGDLELSGEPKRIVERVAFSEAEISAGARVGRNGALLYRPVRERKFEFSWYDRGGRRIEKVFEEIDVEPEDLSRDGRRVTATKWDHSKGAADVYVIDLARGIRTRITSGLSNHASPRWVAGGDRVVFGSDRDGPFDIYAQSDDGTTPAVPLWKSSQDKEVRDVSPSGDTLLIAVTTAERQNDLWILPLGAPEKRREFVATDADEFSGSFSPDGRWIAYLSDRSGRAEIYMRAVDGGRTIQVSTTGTQGFVWSADGSELINRTVDNQRESIALAFAGNDVVPGKAVPLFSAPAKHYRIVAATEKGFAMWTIPDPSDYVTTLHYDSGPPIPE